jgi:hypothetical protein
MKTLIGFITVFCTLLSISLLGQIQPINIGDSILDDGPLHDTSFNLQVKNIALDDNQDLWIAYEKCGIAKYDGTEFFHFYSDEQGFLSDSINFILNHNERIYAATDSSIIYTDYNVNPISWNVFANTEEYFVHSLTADDNYLYALAGNKNYIWELLKINIDTEVIENIEIDTCSIAGWTELVTMTHDNNHNIYWATKSSDGIYKYNGDSTIIVVDDIYSGTMTNFYINGNDLWFSWYAQNPKKLDMTTGITTSIEDMPFYDQNFFYRNSFVSGDGSGIIYIFNRTYDFNTIVKIDGNTAEYFSYRDALFAISSNSMAYKNNNQLYINGPGAGNIYFFNLNDYVDIMTAFTNKNYKFFDRNQVRAGVRSYGSLFWDGQGRAEYAVPYADTTNSLFATAIWMGGYDQNQTLHISGDRFSQGAAFSDMSSAYDFLPGPLTTGDSGYPALCDTATCVLFNRIWKIDRSDILAHISNIENGTTYYVSPDLYSWPAHGPTGYEQNLAPFYDSDSDGIYNPANGDYPELKGDQMLWWVTNDIIAPHNETGGIPLGIEVQYTLYGYYNENPEDEWDDLPNYQTYLNAKIINRSTNSYDSVFCGIWTDGDLGNARDDYMGCDVRHSTYYFYNGDSNDESGNGAIGYGTNPPIQTITFLNAPYENPEFEDLYMNRFMYFNEYYFNYPNSSEGFAGVSYNFLRSYTSDTTQLMYITETSEEIPAYYMFPGDSDPSYIGTNGVPVPEWWEYTYNNTPADRRGVGSNGPFDLAAGEEIEIDILFGFLQNPNERSETGFFDYVPQLDSLINWWNTKTTPSNYNPVLSQGIENIASAPETRIYPNPASENITVSSDEKINVMKLYDLSGKLVKTVNAYSSRCVVPVNDLLPGLYIIEIMGEGYNVKKKLIVN